jgi:hypothetical protein
MKVLVPSAVLLLLVAAAPAFSQPAEFGIADNSFLVEEAFNQEARIFQNIATYRWQRGQWLGSFTQEWPFPDMTHQLSFTLPFGRLEQSTSIGDVLVNYRLQLLEEGLGRPAVAPRVSVIIPSGSISSGLSNGVVGWQFNLPVSKQAGNWYFHWNGGLTLFPADADRFGDGAESLVSPFIAGSAIWQASPRLNVLVEVLTESTAESADNGTTQRSATFTLSPGLRYAFNRGNQQLVVGLAAPLTRSNTVTRGGVFGYLSYELPFK